ELRLLLGAEIDHLAVEAVADRTESLIEPSTPVHIALRLLGGAVDVGAHIDLPGADEPSKSLDCLVGEHFGRVGVRLVSEYRCDLLGVGACLVTNAFDPRE